METDVTRYLTDWAVLGAQIFNDWKRLSIVQLDLHRGNIIWNGKCLTIIDFGGIHIAKYPDDWRKMSRSLTSLLCDLDDDEISALRFGFIQEGQLIGVHIFDYIRTNNSLNAFRNFSNLRYIPFDENSTEKDYDNLIYIDDDWEEIQGQLKFGSLAKHSLLPQHLKQGFSQIDKIEYLTVTSKLNAYKYHFMKHLVVAFRSGSANLILESLLNLQGIYFSQLQPLIAYGLLRYCEYLSEEFQFENSDITNLKKKFFERCCFDATNIPNDYKEIDKFDIIKKTNTIFHVIWCLSDLENGIIKEDYNNI